MSMNLKTIVLLIPFSLISLVAFSLNGYCQDWVLIGSNKYFTLYHNPSSLKIDEKNHVIKISCKRVFTKNGKIEFFKDFNKDNIKEQELNNLNYFSRTIFNKL